MPFNSSDDQGWTNEQVIRLVNEFHARPLLWDPNHDMYRVQIAKYEAWSEIAKDFDCDVSYLRKKFNSIFASHRREKSKVRLGKRSTWFLYDRLSFLPNHVDNYPKEETKEIGGKLEENDQEDIDEGQEDMSEYSNEDIDISHEEIVIKTEPEENPPKKFNMYRKPKLKRVVRHLVKTPRISRQRDRSLSEAVKIIKTSSPTKRKDECDSFGEYIAVSLRKHDQRTQSMIKQAINNILFEQEMKKYNTSHFTIVEMESNPLIIGDDNGDCEK